MDFLSKAVGDAHIVGLGEATHGTHEFFAAKTSLIRYLVEKLGFRVVAFEAPPFASEPIDAYIQTGQGNPAHLLAQLGYWTWNTQEVLDLIVWMQEYNQTLPAGNKVHFTGFDLPQTGLPGIIDAIVAYFQKVDPDKPAQVQSSLSCLRNNDLGAYASLPPATRKECQANLQKISDDFSGKRAAFIASSSKEAYIRINLAIKSLVQIAVYFDQKPTDTGPVRDQFMADNIRDLRDQFGEQAKMILWGHNVHIGANRYVLQDKGTTGDILKAWYGEGYYPIGFVFSTGSFNALPWDKPHQVLPPPQDSYEAFFQEAELPSFFLSLGGIDPLSEIDGWLQGPHCIRSIGAVYEDAKPENYWDVDYLIKEYDAIIYFEVTTPSKMLPNS